MAGFLGLAFEMGVADIGMQKTVGAALREFESVNKVLEAQERAAVRVGKAYGRTKSALNDFGKQVRSEHANFEKELGGLAERSMGRIIAPMDRIASKVVDGFRDNYSEFVGDMKKMADKFVWSAFRNPMREGAWIMGKGYALIRNTTAPHLDFLSKRWATLSDGVVKGAKGASAAFGKAWKTTSAAVGGAVDKVGEKFKGLADRAKSAGEKIRAGFEKVRGGFERLSDGLGAAKQKFDDFSKGLADRARNFNIANISRQMKELRGESGNLTSSLESTMASYTQTAKPIIAELNLSPAEMKKLTSQAASKAYALNMDVGTVTESMKSMRTASEGAKKSMDAMNMSESDWLKVVQTSGLSMADYTSMMGTMSDTMGMSAEQVAATMDSVVSLGKQAGVGMAPMRGLKDQMGGMMESLEKLPPTLKWSAEEMQTSIQSSVKLAGVYATLGKSVEDANSMSQAMNKTFIDSAVQMENALTIGSETALSEVPLYKHLAQITGSADEAQRILRAASKDSVVGMRMISDALASADTGDTGVNRAIADLKAEMTGIAPGAAELLLNTERMNEALDRMGGMAAKAGDGLNRFGKDAYSSGLTLQDTYDRAKEAFDNTFRSIARSGVRDLVGEQIAGMRDAGKELKKLGSDETLGPLVRAMSQYEQMGIGGVFAQIAESSGTGAREAAKFGTITGKVFDVVGRIGEDIAPLMETVGMFGPGGVLAAGLGIAGLFVLDDAKQKEILGSFYGTFSKLEETVKKVFDKIDWKGIWGKAKGFFKGIGDGIKTAFGKMQELGVFSDIADGLQSAFNWFVKAVNWKEVGNRVIGTISGAVNAIAGALDWSSLLDKAITGLGDLVSTIIGKVDWDKVGAKLAEVVRKILPGIAEVAKSLGSALLSVLPDIWRAIGDAFGPAGQVGLVLFGASKLLSSGIGQALMNAAGNSGAAGAFMNVLRGPGGMVALAALAGAGIGTAIWEGMQAAKRKDQASRKAKDKTMQEQVNASIEQGAKERREVWASVTKGPLQSGGDGAFFGDPAQSKAIMAAVESGKIKLSDYRYTRDSATDYVNAAMANPLGGKALSLQDLFGRQWAQNERELSGDGTGKYQTVDFKQFQESLKSFQHLPEVQEKLAEIMRDYTEGVKAAKETGLGVSKSEYEALQQTAVDRLRGMALEYSGGKGASKGESLAKEYDTQQSMLMQVMGSGFTLDPEKAQSVYVGGESVGQLFTEGTVASLNAGAPAIEQSLGDSTAVIRGKSPPEVGPLSGEGMDNAAYRAGFSTMEQFSFGIADSYDVIRASVEQVLNEAVILTLDTYSAKMQELASQKSMLGEVAKAMVRDLGGNLVVDANPEYDVNVKKNFEAAMSLPGLASVTLAIVNEGAMTRKLLGKMLEESVKQTGLMGGTGGQRVVPAPAR